MRFIVLLVRHVSGTSSHHQVLKILISSRGSVGEFKPAIIYIILQILKTKHTRHYEIVGIVWYKQVESKFETSGYQSLNNYNVYLNCSEWAKMYKKDKLNEKILKSLKIIVY